MSDQPGPGWVRRFLGRYPSTNVPIFGFGVMVYGWFLLLGSPIPFRAPIYLHVFSVVPRGLWAAAFIVTGLGALYWVSVISAMALIFVLMLWAANWLVATLSHPEDVPAFSPVLICAVAVSLAVSVARRGATFGAGHYYPHLSAAIADAQGKAAAYGSAESLLGDLETMVSALSYRFGEQT